jgi:predicted Zn-dependent peptidase
MDYELKTLPNGLRVLTVPMPSPASATLTVWVGVGSRFETPKISGISHFLEHMAFKGSSKRPSAAAISQAIDGMGAENNAGTSRDWTNFYIKTRADKIETAYDLLPTCYFGPC